MKQEFDDLDSVKEEFYDLDSVNEVKEELEDSCDETVLNEDVGISHAIDFLASEPVPPSSPAVDDPYDDKSPASDGAYDAETSDEALNDPYQ